MRALTRLMIRWPWITVAVILGITVFFAIQLKNVRIDNGIKNFLPEMQLDKQQYYRSEEIFGSESVAVVGITAEDKGPYRDIFNPAALKIVQELHDWFEGLEIEGPVEKALWVKPEQLDEVRKTFSNPDGLCSEKQLAALEKFEEPEDFEGYIKITACKHIESTPIEEVTSLVSIKDIYDTEVPSAEKEGEMEHQLMIEDMWENVPQTQEEADRVRERVKSWDLYEDNIVSPDMKSTAIYVFIDSQVSIEYTEKLQSQIEEKIKEYDKPDDGLFLQTGGTPLLFVWLGIYLQNDLRTLIPFVFFVIILVLFASFRNPTGVLMPVLTVACGCIWSVGLTALMNKPLTLLTSALPTLIVAVGSAYTIHIIHNYFAQRQAGRDRREAIIEAMAKVGMAVVMAGLTTVGGFLSLASSSVLPIRDLGFFAGFGAFASLVISCSLVPALLQITGKKGAKEVEIDAENEAEHVAQNPGLLGKILDWLARFVVEHKWLVFGVGVALVGVGIFLTVQVRVTSDLLKYFKEDSPIRQMDTYLSEKFGGTDMFSLTFDGGEENYWKNPAPLRKMEALIAYVDAQFPVMRKTMSMVDYVKKMNMALHFNDPQEFRIPDTSQAVADSLFLFQQKSDSMESMVDFEYRKARVTFKVTDGQTATMRTIKKAIDQWLAENWPEMAGKPAPRMSMWQRTLEMAGFVEESSAFIEQRYNYSGGSYLRYVADRLIVIGQMRSIFLSILTVFVLAMIIFRSLVGGLLSIVPTMMAVLGNFATMTLFDMPLDVGTALVSAAAVGIGIDYAIHYINRYRLERIAGAKAPLAVRYTHLTSGKAIVFNAAAVALGFFVLLFSNFNPVVRMGLLTGITMFTASFISLTALPVLLVLLRPKFISKNEPNNNSIKGGNK